MASKTFNLVDLLDWLESLLDHRATHADEWFMLFANEERYVELNLADDEIWVGAVTNTNLTPAERMTDADELTLLRLGWALEEEESPEPKFVRRWSPNASSAEIATVVLQALTAIYMRPDADEIEVLRGTFAGGNLDWDSAF